MIFLVQAVVVKNKVIYSSPEVKVEESEPNAKASWNKSMSGIAWLARKHADFIVEHEDGSGAGQTNHYGDDIS